MSIEDGYNVIRVNTTVTVVLGKKAYPSIADIPERVDMVDVFRKSEDVPGVVDYVLKKDGIKATWNI